MDVQEHLKPATGHVALVALGLIGLAVGGCPAVTDEEAVGIYGYLMVGPELTQPPMALTGGTFEAYGDDGELLFVGEEPWPEDYPGYYRVRELEPEQHVQLLAGARGDAGFVPTAHQAWTATANLYAYDGELFILETSWLELLLEQLGSDGLGPTTVADVLDPDVEQTGGFVLGSLADASSGEGTRIEVLTGDDTVEALYLDDDGVARADLQGTGPGGWFAVFGLPVGPAELIVRTAEGEDLAAAIVIFEDTCTSVLGLEVVP